MTIALTGHASARIRQRGIPESSVLTNLLLFDLEVPVARGLHALRVSRRTLEAARLEGLDGHDLDRLRRIALIESADGSLVTVTHLHGRKSRAYRRRERRKFWR